MFVFCIVDIETCGGRFEYKRSRITEICIIVHDGLQVIETFHSLINPECNINPYFINISGITNAMVAEAPKFYEIADRIIELTQNRIFVAHNAAFDFGFIKAEFDALGYKFDCDTLCTVRLSRKLLPGMHSYSLGNLCSSLGITIEHRHRAHGDAQATVVLFERLLELKAIDPLWKHKGLEALMHSASKKRIPKLIADLPEACGIYYFYNQHNEIIYIGKSTNIRKRAQSHALSDSIKSKRMIQELYSVSYDITGSALIALLKENAAIKQWQPKFNHTRKHASFQYAIDCIENEHKPLQLKIEKLHHCTNPLQVFKSRGDALKALQHWVERYELCASYCGLSQASSHCFEHYLKRCRGVCTGNEPITDYNLRVKNALQRFQYPHDNFIIFEKGRTADETGFIKILNRKFQGYGFISTESQLYEAHDFESYFESSVSIAEHDLLITSYLFQNKPRIKVLNTNSITTPN